MYSINQIIWGWGVNSLYLLYLSHRAKLSSDSKVLRPGIKVGGA